MYIGYNNQLNMTDLLTKINKVERIANATKLQRLFADPLKYNKAILFRNFVYPITKKGMMSKASLFFGGNMSVLLPAGTDLYLTQGKSHDSEIRLARFLISNLKDGDVFIDVGAHFGYYTLLAASIVGNKGKVLSFEASKNTFEILARNTINKPNVQAFNNAVSDENGELIFNEFPVLYSEYNSLDTTQFQGESWFQNNKAKSSKVKAVKLDDIVQEHSIIPKIIKIDVEGAEYKVIQGATKLLRSHNTILVLEYLSSNRGNKEHAKAAMLLSEINYKPFAIDSKGRLVMINDIELHFNLNNLESDNLVFMHGHIG